MKVVFKCRKCRTVLLIYPDCCLLNVHGEQMELKSNSNPVKIEFAVDKNPSCSTRSQDVFYTNETNIPQWITDCIDKGEWTKGKLQCPGCSSRLGSFDFVSGFHCSCQSSVVPAIHLVKSKVDYSSSLGLFNENYNEL